MSIWVFGDYSWVGAGLFNLFATFLTPGEPAPTVLLKIVQDVGKSEILQQCQ